jgi:hypothetical protein
MSRLDTFFLQSSDQYRPFFCQFTLDMQAPHVL